MVRMIHVTIRTWHSIILRRYHVNCFCHGTMNDIAAGLHMHSLMKFKLLLKTLKTQDK